MSTTTKSLQSIDDVVEQLETLTLGSNKKKTTTEYATGVAYDELMLKHFEEDHPERPKRLLKILEQMKTDKIDTLVTNIKCRQATEEELKLVHTEAHVNCVLNYLEDKKSDFKNSGRFLRDSLFHNKHTKDAALMSAGSVLELTEQVCSGKLKNGFAIVRPPGHHAGTPNNYWLHFAGADYSQGFCYFNNIALAARYAQKHFGITRVMIVDFDVHHGNGTQDIFYDDPNVLFFSSHRKTYPGTGPITEIGGPKALGKTINVPFAKAYSDVEMVYIMDALLLPVAKEFDPELVLISAGYDAVQGDFLGGNNLSTDIYGYILHKLLPFANGKMICALEGGYNKEQTALAASSCIKTLLTGECPKPEDSKLQHKSVVDKAIELHAPHWKCLQQTTTTTTTPSEEKK